MRGRKTFTFGPGRMERLVLKVWRVPNAEGLLMAKLEGRGFAYVRDVYAELQQARSGTRPAN